MRIRGLALLAVAAGLMLVAAPARTEKKGRVITTYDGAFRGHQREIPRHVMLGLTEALRECLGNVDSAAPDAPLVLDLLFEFGGAGTVSKIKAAGSENAPPAFLACAKRRAMRIRIPPPDGGAGHSTQSYAFLPAERSSVTPGRPKHTPAIELDRFERDAIQMNGPSTPIVVRLEPQSGAPAARLARALRAKVEACTQNVPQYTGAVGVALLARPDGLARSVVVSAEPPEPKLVACLRGDLAETGLPAHSGLRAWRVRLGFAVDDRGVSLVQ